jgi:hypothetical protein
VWVTATVTDQGPNVSPVKAAEGFIDAAGTPAAGSGWTMLPVDGVFDQPVEQVYAQIPLSEIARLSDGSHVFSVRGLDVAGNWGALATGTLQIDKTGPAVTAQLTSATVQRGHSVHLTGSAVDGSLVNRFEYFLDAGPATTVILSVPSSPGVLTVQNIQTNNQTTLGLHYVFVRARDVAGNWSTWTQLPLTVVTTPVPIGTFAVPAGLEPLVAPAAGAQPVRITVKVTGSGHLVSVVRTPAGAVRARFVFSPHGVKIRGSKTILKGRDAAGHIVLTVQVRGDAKHGYHLRALSGGKRSAWLSLPNRRAVLETALNPGSRPILIRSH